jgi:methylated-DNA-[protein]-cysteine S-methyltransferase
MNVSPELDARFRAAAADAGLLDVAYDLVDTPLGRLLVAATDAGVCRISYDPEPEREIETLAKLLGTRVLRTAKPIDPARRQLDEYFEQQRQEFDVDLAVRAARPRAARAVGTVMNRNPIPIILPCHRVVGANGSLVGYGGGLERKEALLRLEGALL